MWCLKEKLKIKKAIAAPHRTMVEELEAAVELEVKISDLESSKQERSSNRS
jgi:hypothetical protein